MRQTAQNPVTTIVILLETIPRGSSSLYLPNIHDIIASVSNSQFNRSLPLDHLGKFKVFWFPVLDDSKHLIFAQSSDSYVEVTSISRWLGMLSVQLQTQDVLKLCEYHRDQISQEGIPHLEFWQRAILRRKQKFQVLDLVLRTIHIIIIQRDKNPIPNSSSYVHWREAWITVCHSSTTDAFIRGRTDVSSSKSTCSETLYKTTLAFELSEQVGRRKLGRKERTRCIPYTSYQLVESFSALLITIYWHC